MSKDIIGYRFDVGENSEYHFATLELRLGVPLDAAKEFAEYVGGEHEDYYKGRLLAVKANSDGNTIYFCERGRNGFSIRWQANKPGYGHESLVGTWYGAGVRDLDFKAGSLEFFHRVRQKVRKLAGNRGVGGFDNNSSPLDIVQALGTDAWQVKYGGSVDMWHMIPGRPEHLEKAPGIVVEA